MESSPITSIHSIGSGRIVKDKPSSSLFTESIYSGNDVFDAEDNLLSRHGTEKPSNVVLDEFVSSSDRSEINDPQKFSSSSTPLRGKIVFHLLHSLF